MRYYLIGILALVVLLAHVETFGQVELGGAPTIDMNYMSPKTFEIGGIEVTGVKFLDPNAMIAVSGLKIGDEINIPGDRIAAAIRKMWDQGIIGDVEVTVTKIEGKYIFLNFELKERPRLAKFSFKGTKKGETNDLRDKIQLIRGRVVTDAMVKNTRNIIKKHFVEKGFLNTTVTVKQIEDTTLNNSVSLQIEVDKGKKVKISEITFDGNSEFSDKQLRRKLKETKQRSILRIFKSSRFIRPKFEEDKVNLVKFYNKEGFRDAQILGDSLARLNEKRVALNVKLFEGQRYYFRNINWTGNYLYDDKILNNILSIRKGDIYNKELLDRKLNFNPNGADVSSLYMDDGYLFFSVEPVEVVVDGDSIDLEMRMYEGPQATINRITVQGNTKTNDHVVLREIRTLPGQKFNRSELVRTQTAISQLGYFNPEAIGMQPIPNPADGTVDIAYTVEERPSDQIELSGGWGGLFGFVGTLGLTFNNFSLRRIPNFKEWSPLPSGDGQRLSLRGQANGRQFQTYSFSFTEPWLGGRRPNSFTVGVSHSVQRTFGSTFNQAAGRNIGPGRLGVTGVNVSLGRRLRRPDDYFTLLNTISLQQYNLRDFPFTQTFFEGNATNVSFTTVLARNSVNNPIFPSSGSSISASVQLTPPYSLLGRDYNSFTSDAERFRYIEYNKWNFDASWFTPIANKLVLNTRAHFGFIGTYSRDVAASPFERFRLGGDGITGFNFLLGYDIIGLRGYPNTSIGPISRQERDGVAFTKYVSELRYAISTNPSATVYALGFLEAGNNWGALSEFAPFNVFRSGGVGVRIFMPAFGLIGFDYGWGFDYQKVPGNAPSNPGQFHFTIGQQIR